MTFFLIFHTCTFELIQTFKKVLTSKLIKDRKKIKAVNRIKMREKYIQFTDCYLVLEKRKSFDDELELDMFAFSFDLQ